jgi:hypothetical protein
MIWQHSNTWSILIKALQQKRENLDFVAGSYLEAGRILLERFDKPNKKAEEHIKPLFAIKAIDRVTSNYWIE